MTPTDDEDFTSPAEAVVVRRARWLRWLVALSVVTVLAAGVTGWSLRRSVAERTLAGWCAERGLACEARFERLGSDGATVRDLVVSGGGRRAFESGEVRVRLEWPRLFTPRVTGIEMDRAVLHGELADGRLGFHGLERLIPSGGQGSGALPAFDIRDGRILIATSAGEVGATVSLSGAFPRQGRASLVLDPASLDEPQGYVRWSGGMAEFLAEDGRIEGHADFSLEEVRTDGVRITDADLTLTLDGRLDDAEPARLVWDGAVGRADGAAFHVEALETGGEVRFEIPAEASAGAVLSALTVADVQLRSGAAEWAGLGVGAARLETALRGRDGAFSGPAELFLSNAVLPQGRAGGLEVAGNLDWSPADGLSFSGQVAVSKAGVPDEVSASLLGRLTLPAPLSAHGQALRTALGRALADISGRGEITMRAAGNGIAIGAQGAASFRSASGLALSVTPDRGRPWLSLEDGRLFLSGAFALDGGGAPRLSVDVRSLAADGNGFLLSTGAVRLSPWTVNRVRLGADLSSLTLQVRPDELSANAAGSLSLSGPVSGLDLSPSRLSGALQIGRDGDGLRVEPVLEACLSFETEGVGLGGVAFQPATLRLCPKAGAFMKPGMAPGTGAALLGDVSWPFASKSVSGTLNLREAVVGWSTGPGLSFTVSSPELSLPLDIKERTLTIDAVRPRVSLATASGQSPRLSAGLESAVLGGTLIPAKVSAGRIAFDGQIGPGGLSGDFAGDSVLIRDFRDDPVYQPLLSDLTARMDAWRLVLTGPLRLQASGLPVGDIEADIDVLRLNGTARVASRPLEFRKGGLQPVMLSERLRGVYTDAVGRMEAVSDVVISGGDLSGTARVSVSDFGFQTTRLGRVQDVDGEVEFSDLFSLTTGPSQVLTIGGMNPGVPLQDGRIAFRFSEGRVLDVASVEFPFSGGRLALSPFSWTLGADTQHVEVTADAIDLADLVRTLDLPEIEAEGTVSGRFPIDVERTKVLIRDAHLYADPGGGRLAYLGDAADAAAKSDANVHLAFEALKDFDFSVLEVGLDGNVADRLTITLKLAGKSRKDITYGDSTRIARGQPFEFNIAIDTALAELFRSSQYYTSQQKITDFVVEEVLTEHGLRPVEDE